MRNSGNTLKKLEKLLVEVYNRTQQPTLSTELWKGTITESLYTDFGVGKNYRLESFLNAGALRVVKEFSQYKKTVIWNAGYPDAELALRVHENKNVTNKREPKIVTTEPTTIEKEDSTSFIDIDKIIDKFNPEYLNYTPEKNTIPKVTKMIRVLKHNAQDRYCNKEQIFCLSYPDESGEIVTTNHRAAHQYSFRRLVDLRILERNPKNNSEYRFIAEFDDIDDFSRRVAFASNYLTNRQLLEDLRNARLQTTMNNLLEYEGEAETKKVEEILLRTPPTVTTTPETQDILLELRMENQKLTQLYSLIRAENKKMYTENQENMRLLREATEKLTQVGLKLGKNNGMLNPE